MERPIAAFAAFTGLTAALFFALKRRQAVAPSSTKAAQRPAAGAALPPADDAEAPAAHEVEDSAADLSDERKAAGDLPLAEHDAQHEQLAGSVDAALAAARAPLYRAAPNELLVHSWLLQGQEGDAMPSLPPLDAGQQTPGRLAAGRPRGAAAPRPSAAPDAGLVQEPGMQHPGAGLQRAVRETVERAFFDALADGLRRGESERLAALLLDARDQLAALLPPPAGGAEGGPGGSGAPAARGEGQQLLAELQEKLDTEYVRQRLRRYDAQYCAQAFGLLLHVIARLQAPARRAATQEQCARVAAAFAAAVQAEAEAQARGGLPRGRQSGVPGGGVPGDSQPGEERVRLRLSLAEGGEHVGVQLSAASPSQPPAEQLEGLEWRLLLEPAPEGGGAVRARLTPSLGGATAGSASIPSPAGSAAQGAGRSGELEASAAPVPGEASVAAVVGAARFLLRQLEELRVDVARARLALLKRSVLGGAAAAEYERARFQRVLQAANAALAGGAGGDAVAAAFPATLSWLRRVLQEAPPQPGLECAAACRACLSAGLLQLVQRARAVSVQECPETLLLDLGGIVAAQNELQRVCLVAASGLIAQQVLAARGALPPPGSPARRQLDERVAGRVGALLAAEVGMEGLALELHACVEAALQPQEASLQEGGPAASPRGQQQAPPTQQAGQAGPDLELVRGMVSRIFSTEDPVYRRVQAGVLAALAALLQGAEAHGGGGGGDEGGGGAAGWRQALRGVGAEALAGDVYLLAARLYRLASVSTAVAEPVVYAPLLRLLRQEQGAA